MSRRRPGIPILSGGSVSQGRLAIARICRSVGPGLDQRLECQELKSVRRTGSQDQRALLAGRIRSTGRVAQVLAIGRDAGLQSTRAFIDWSSANADVLI